MFLLLCVKPILGQITASPSFTGCAPYSIVLSGPAGASTIFWTLGSSIGTTTLSSPNPIYSSPGTYNITYTAVVNNNPVNYSAQVVVKPKPVPSFAAVMPPSHCAPMVVTLSGSGGSAGSTYIWAFGDLSSTGSGAVVTHTYVTANSFVPILTVIDAVSGCTASANSNVTVNVSSLPTLVINSSNGFNACAPPFVTTFDANGSNTGSPLGGGLNYSWSFNVGNPSNASGANTGAITFGAGTHTITMNATDNNQCSTSKIQYVSVVNPSLTATFPSTICFNSPIPGTITTNQSNASVSILGASGSTLFSTPSSVTAIDTVFFSDQGLYSPGSHTVQVSVQPLGCPAITYTQAIFIESITVNFTWPNPTITCQPSLVATYVNQTTLNTNSSMSFTWNADNMPLNYNQGVPNSSVIVGLSSPTFTFSQGHLNPYVIYQPFQPMITLIAQSNSMAHCTAKLMLPGFTIIRPTAFFIRDTLQACAPLAVTFTDVSFTHILYPITNYTWSNGASPPTYSIGTVAITPPNSNGIPDFSFTYTAPGVYYPYLQIQTASGCTDISFHDTITVAVPPLLTATYPGTVCAGQPFTIHMASTPTSSLVDHWHVTTDNSFFSGCVTDSTPTFAMTHPGVHPVILSGYTYHCGASDTLIPTILVKGPIGKFRMETDCSANRRAVKFNVHLQEATSAILNFGDGNTTNFSGNPIGSASVTVSHTYQASGDYTVTLTTSGNNGCGFYVFKQTAKIRSAKANILYNSKPIPALPQAMACVRDPYLFGGSTSTDHLLSCEYLYTWFFQTPTYTLAPLNLGYIPPPIGIPKDSFASFPLPPDTVAYVDPVSYDRFRTPGIYTISLLVKDINGCVDIDVKPFRISSAAPVFTFAANPACLSAGAIQLINTTQNNQVYPDTITNYKWNFGDNTADTVGTNPYFIPKHNYYATPPPSQTFAVMSIASNNVGCTDTTIHTIQINNPLPYFQASSDHVCIPLYSSGVISYSAGSGYATYSVNYGDPPSQPWVSTPNFYNANHAYATPGVYHPNLTVADNAGCMASEALTITAYGQPTAAISFPDNKMKDCTPWTLTLSSTSSINTTPITNFIWSVGNVSSPLPGSPTLANTYYASSTTVSLTVSITNNAYCAHTTSVLVNTADPLASASISPTLICLGETINASIFIDRNVAQWQWYFGDFVQQPIRYNTIFTPTTVSYPYTTFPTTGATGTAVVTLYYHSDNDPKNTCRGAVEIPIRVIKVASDFKNIAESYMHCLKIADAFTSTSANFPDLNLNYDWSFGDQTTGSSATGIYSHTYSQAGVYTITLTTRDVDYGCKAVSTKQMTVFPLPSATLSAKPNVCPGVAFLIEGQGSPGVSGLVTGTLSPNVTSDSLAFQASNSFTTMGSLTQSGDIILTVTDNNKCTNTSNSFFVNVQKAAPQITWDTTVVIGQVIPLNAYVGSGYTYTWTPLVDYLNCYTCTIYNPVSSTTASIIYSVAVEDGMNCSVVKNTYRINVEVKVSLDVPTAFTPNGDGLNDIIFPNGWGLRKLNYFKIFNRWGQLIFESNDLSIGWDGIFQGVPQNMETYVYQVSAETFLDKQPTLTKAGTFKLIR